MKYTSSKKTVFLGLWMIVGLLTSCGSLLTADKNQKSESILQFSGEGKSVKNECSAEILSSNGLSVLSTDAQQCAAMQTAGDERCNQMAQYAGIEGLSLQFYIETDGKNTQCGCECKEDEIFPEVSPCMQEVRDILVAQGYNNYIYTENYMLLQEVDLNYDLESSKDRCNFREGVLDIPLTTEIVEVNGQTYLACVCQDSMCGVDDQEDIALSEKYDDFGQGDEEEPFRIYTEEQLFSMSRYVGALDKNYELCRNLDLDDFYGFDEDHVYFSIGSFDYPFSGNFNGNNFEIKTFTYKEYGNNYINPEVFPVYAMDSFGVVLRDTNKGLGLFGVVENSQIYNIDVVNVDIDISDSSNIGGLVGFGENLTCSNIKIQGQISAKRGKNLGGLSGQADGNLTKIQSNVNIQVESFYRVGGLVGFFYDGELKMSSASGNLLGDLESDSCGGLVGINGHSGISGASPDFPSASEISMCFSKSTVTGGNRVGGLVGGNFGGQIVDSIANTSVNGFFYVGGLVGTNTNHASIIRAAATGNVVGVGSSAGGLVGETFVYTSIEDSFTVSSVQSGGWVAGTVVSAYFDNLHYWSGADCIGSCTASNGEIAHSEQEYFYNPNNAPLNVWDFENIWSIDEGNGLPYLDF